MTADLTRPSSTDFGVETLTRQAVVVSLALVLLIGVWGGLAPISAAVIATGEVTGETGPRAVEHPVGGRVVAVLAREGESVRQGAIIARLAPVAVEAAALYSDERVAELDARRRRLRAERDGGGLVVSGDTARLTSALQAEQTVLSTRRRLDAERSAQLDQEVAQAHAQIAGLTGQLRSTESQRALIGGELEGMRRLLSEGYATVTRVNALEREAHRLDGERGTLSASIARERARIAQINVQRLQLVSERQATIMEELKQTDLQLSEARAQNSADADARRNLLITAPVTGRVQQLAMRTGGGVLAAGEAMAVLVPDRERLIVEVRITPDKIDRLKVGQAARVRFPAFAAATTPEFGARLVRISPTVNRDPQTGAPFYVAACEILASDHPSLRRLRPGMPAEAHIAIGSQRAMAYFLKPLLDQISRTFREP